MVDRIPQTDAGQKLAASLSEKRWARVVTEAEARARIFDEVAAKVAGGKSWPVALAEVAPALPWPTFVRWKRRHGQATGESWERLLDRRPRLPSQKPVDPQVVAVVVGLRKQDPHIRAEEAADAVTRVFGAMSTPSIATLKRIWAAAGVNLPAGRSPRTRAVSGAAAVNAPAPPPGATPADSAPSQDVILLHGGAGLAFLAAAEAEFGAAAALASATRDDGLGVAETAGPFAGALDDSPGRDAHGHFTAAYAQRWREGVEAGEADSRWDSDASKASARDLQKLRVLRISEPTLAQHLLAIGASPLLSDRRGLDGLEGPAGAWLAALGGTAYMPKTLDKTLSELGYLKSGGAMWQAHADTWTHMSRRWEAPAARWKQTTIFIDGTADPYWTRHFALSGKISRVGRTMPCVSRITLNSGAGLPLLVETHAGTAPLRARILPMLEKLNRAIGPEAQANRLVIIDSEAGVAAMLLAMKETKTITAITVLKGQVLAGTKISAEGPWQAYRQHDQLRGCTAVVKGKDVPEEGLTIRAVQQQRLGRDGAPTGPTTTYAVVGVSADDLTTQEVADEYLKRWPRQEHIFRKLRNGGGLNHAHGYGGGYVTNVSLVVKQEKAQKSKVYADKRLAKAESVRASLPTAEVEPEDQPSKALKSQADQVVKARKKTTVQKQQLVEKLADTPSEIYERDMGRDSIATCCKLTVMALLETVLKEYFGGLAMELRTFIEQILPLPVTIRSDLRTCVYEIQANPRQPKLMQEVQRAVAEVNRRGLKRDGQVLRFELLGVGS